MALAHILRRKILKYLEIPSAERRTLSATIWNIEARLPDTVIFGGMLREFSLGNARHFVSDIDLVSNATTEEIATVLEPYNATLNKFGGFRFIVGRRRFDLWSLKETWAFRKGYVQPHTFNALLQTSFFNLDAAFFHLGRREVIALPGYDLWIKNRYLEVNLEPNPNPRQMVRRTLELVLNNNLQIGPQLRSFLGQHGNSEGLTWPQNALRDRLLSSCRGNTMPRHSANLVKHN